MSDHAYTSPQSSVIRPWVTDILQERKSLMVVRTSKASWWYAEGPRDSPTRLRRGVADSEDEAGDRSRTSGGHRPVSRGLIIG